MLDPKRRAEICAMTLEALTKLYDLTEKRKQATIGVKAYAELQKQVDDAIADTVPDLLQLTLSLIEAVHVIAENGQRANELTRVANGLPFNPSPHTIAPKA